MFNFCTIGALYSGGVCFFHRREKARSRWELCRISNSMSLDTKKYRALGAARAFDIGGQLVMLNYNRKNQR